MPYFCEISSITSRLRIHHHNGSEIKKIRQNPKTSATVQILLSCMFNLFLNVWIARFLRLFWEHNIFPHHNLSAFSFLLFIPLWQQSHIPDCGGMYACVCEPKRRAVTVRSDTWWLGLQDTPLSRLSHLRQARMCVCYEWAVITGCTSCSCASCKTELQAK